MNRTTNRTMKRTTKYRNLAVGAVLAFALAASIPSFAFAASDHQVAQASALASTDVHESVGEGASSPPSLLLALVKQNLTERVSSAQAAQNSEADNKLLAYDPADIAAIGTQEETGHSICCPSFSCAYADAVMDGTVHEHEYYTCSNCSWTDWGGGDSWDRCVGDDEELLREAYDQISAGRPTVIHLSASYGEHWVALIGYQNVTDPDHLTLDNFIALDPWDGEQIVASDRFELYGDGCEHVSER